MHHQLHHFIHQQADIIEMKLGRTDVLKRSSEFNVIVSNDWKTHQRMLLFCIVLKSLFYKLRNSNFVVLKLSKRYK